MILYFSATGNSKFVAKSLANILCHDVYSMLDVVPPVVKDTEHLIMVFPIYSWGVPPIVEAYIRNIHEDTISRLASHQTPISMVATCGDEVALASEQFSQIWLKRNPNLNIKGAWSVIMPNTYVLLPGFDVDDPEVERKKLDNAPQRIRHIASQIREGALVTDVIRGSNPRLKSKLVYPLFLKWGISPQKWSASEECIRCGRCVKACPVGNVSMKAGTPHWGKNCISCLACYHHCPTHAISYRSFTNSKGQYFCHLAPLKNKF